MRGADRTPAVLIVEDHPAVRRALREFIGVLRPELRLIEACGAIRRIREGAPGCCVVAVSVDDDDAHRAAAAAAGATAFIAKRSLPGDLPRLLETQIHALACAAARLQGEVP